MKHLLIVLAIGLFSSSLFASDFTIFHSSVDNQSVKVLCAGEQWPCEEGQVQLTLREKVHVSETLNKKQIFRTLKKMTRVNRASFYTTFDVIDGFKTTVGVAYLASLTHQYYLYLLLPGTVILDLVVSLPIHLAGIPFEIHRRIKPFRMMNDYIEPLKKTNVVESYEVKRYYFSAMRMVL